MWYLDNGASNHMTGDRYLFQDLNEISQGIVRFGDGVCNRHEKSGLWLLFVLRNLNFLLLAHMTFISKVTKFLTIITFYLGLVARSLFVFMLMLFTIISASSSSSSPFLAMNSSNRTTFIIFLWFPYDF